MHPSIRWPPSQASRENGGGVGSFQPPAKYVETSCCVSARMFTEKRRASRIEWLMCADLPQQNRMSGGSSNSEEKALAVIPRMSPVTSAVITVTPVAKWPTVCRNVLASNAGEDTGLPWPLPFLDHGADVVRVDQIRHRPAVEIVFGHALLGEPLVALRGAGHFRDQERLETDALVVAEVVSLVQLVAAAELRTDRVPHQLHQLHAIDGRIAVRTAHVLIEVRPDLRRAEVERARRQIDKAAG